MGPSTDPERLAFLYGTAAFTLYAAGLRREGRLRALGGLAALAVVVLASQWARTPLELGVGLVLGLGGIRSGLLHRSSLRRAALVESALGIAGLLALRLLAADSLLSWTLALWGFFLVQSLFFLLPGPVAQGTTHTESDPFERSHRLALTLLQDR